MKAPRQSNQLQLQLWVAVVEEPDVVLRSRYTIKKLVGLKSRMTVMQREGVKAIALWPFLEYPNIGMERHLMLALIKRWVSRWKGFRVGGRRVSFSIFDIVLFTDLPMTGSIIELDGDEVSTNVGEMVRGRMAEWEREEMVRRVLGRSGKKRRFFRNYVSTMEALCEENNGDDRVGLWVRIMHF